VVVATQYMRAQPGKKIALRVAFDVNNGAGGNTVTFYTSDTIGGTWTQVGDPVITTGTTSIFSSTANLAIGHATNLAFREPVAKVYKAEVRNGIAGSVVANPDFTAQTVGATSFADAAGRTWNINSPAAITNRNTRFYGRITSWPTRWQTGSLDATVQVTAAASLRRLGQGSSPIRSALYREYTKSTRTGIIDYWPMEEGDQATSFGSGFDGHSDMDFSGDIDLSSFSTYPPTSPLPTFRNGFAVGAISPYTDTGFIGMRAFVQLSSTPPAAERSLLVMETTGTVEKWVARLDTANKLALIGYDDSGTAVVSTGFSNYYDSSVPTHILIQLTQNGTGVDWRFTVYDCRGSALSGIRFLELNGTQALSSLGRIRRARVGATGTDLNNVAVGHVAVINDAAAFTDTGQAMMAWRAEPAVNRFRRLANEDGQAVYTWPGDWPSTGGDTRMGSQGEATLLSLLRTGEDCSNGLLFESREADALILRTGDGMYAQSPLFTLNYKGSDGLVTPLDPDEDDQSIVNNMTVSRVAGSSRQVIKTSGTLNVNFPEVDPQGAGPYEDSAELDVFQDSQCEQFAAWAVHLGTWDEWRFPQVTIKLQKAPSMIDAVTRAYPGDIFEITNMPSFAPPVTVRQRILGASEFISQYQWEVTFNCQPGRPWSTAVESVGRADTSGSSLAANITTTATSMDVYTYSGPNWIDTAGFSTQFPFGVTLGGEDVTVSAVANVNTDTFTRTVASGWGSSDTGLAWTNSGGAAGDYAVGTGFGSHTMPSTSVPHISTFPYAATNDMSIQADITSPAALTGTAGVRGGLLLRETDPNNLYNAQLDFGTANNVTLSLRKRVASVETQLATYAHQFVHVPGTTIWRLKFEVQGTTLRAKVWPTTFPEPGGWQITAVDSDLASGGLQGVRSVSVAGNTNVNPVLRYDNLALYNPQTFTVTRSVNGVVKAQVAGEGVALTTPYIAGL
jgi:hypothetical protein